MVALLLIEIFLDHLCRSPDYYWIVLCAFRQFYSLLAPFFLYRCLLRRIHPFKINDENQGPFTDFKGNDCTVLQPALNIYSYISEMACLEKRAHISIQLSRSVYPTFVRAYPGPNIGFRNAAISSNINLLCNPR